MTAGMITFLASWGLLSGLLGDVTAGGNRPVVVHVPPSYDPSVPIPLVIALHGWGGDGNGHESYWRVLPLADARGFLYAFPNGNIDPSGSRFWNATDACCYTSGPRPDDSKYLRSLIEEIASRFNVDRDRVSFCGLSNGGFMSYRMACDHADLVTSIASQAGATFDDPADCAPSAPVHVLQIHGTVDNVITYAPGDFTSGKHPGAVGSAERWARYDGCSIPGKDAVERLDFISDFAGAETTMKRYTEGCLDGGSVELWTMVGGSHVPNLVSAKPPTADLAARIVEWLLSHPRRTSPIASITLTQPGGPGSGEVILDASSSTAPGGTALAAYKWDLGDGTKEEGIEIAHTYASPGRFIAALRVVTDDQRVSLAATRQFIIPCPAADLAPSAADDVGEVAYPGSARRESGESGEKLIACLGGTTFSAKSDSFFFIHREVAGDFQITAKVPRIAVPTCKVSLMARANLAAGAPFAAMALESSGSQSGNRFRLRYRLVANATGGSQAGQPLDLAFGWLRLERRGSLFKGMSSLDGIEWTTVLEQRIEAIPSPAFVGVAAAANDTRPDARFEAFQTEITALEIKPLAARPSFRRGDANADGKSDISDAISTLSFLFAGTDVLPCLKSADTNDDGRLDVSDAVAELGYLFLDSPAPPAPYPSCGEDPKEDGLGCEAYPGCV